MTLPKIIIGAQWGDEGKGKIVDFLTENGDYVVRFNGGNNAGHTIVLNGEKFALSLLPSGVLWKKRLLISQGVVINPEVILSEISFFTKRGLKPQLTIDPRVNIVMPYHQWLDAATERSKGSKRVGSLKLGIGYCYEDRNNRHGIRLEDLVEPKTFREKFLEEFDLKAKRLRGVYGFRVLESKEEIYRKYLAFGKKLKPYIGDVSKILSGVVNKKKVIFEGAHGTFLDANFGTYPYTTAVNTITGSVFSYTGIPGQDLDVVAVVKAYTTRVGGGPFPSELFDDTGEFIQEKGHEFGTVSKRKRRTGWLDLPMLRLSNRLNGFSTIAITKLDVLSGLRELKIVTGYKLGNQILEEFPSALKDVKKVIPIYKIFNGWESDISRIKKYKDLPFECKKYIEFIEKELITPVNLISIGAERKEIIIRS